MGAHLGEMIGPCCQMPGCQAYETCKMGVVEQWHACLSRAWCDSSSWPSIFIAAWRAAGSSAGAAEAGWQQQWQERVQARFPHQPASTAILSVCVTMQLLPVLAA